MYGCFNDIPLVIGKYIEKLYKPQKKESKITEEFLIKNGFATLKNEIYLFSPESQSDNTFTFQKNGIRYEIEKRICRPAVKPNILKNESDITENLEQLIFPYIVVGNKVLVMSETLIQQEYPLAYAYLSDFKIPLSERDKGNRKYEEWFAFGRSQALDIKGYKLLFPYLSDKPYFVFTDELDLLFYNGYALVSDTEDELRFIQKILKSDVFWYYIKHTSKPYGGDYFALAKNYVKNFGVYNFSNDQKQRILEIEDSAVYGKLVDMGATMIQTDRPELLISYLRSRGLHD